MKVFIAIIFIYFFTAVWIKAACKRKDPHFNDCIKETFQAMFPYMAKGKVIKV